MKEMTSNSKKGYKYLYELGIKPEKKSGVQARREYEALKWFGNKKTKERFLSFHKRVERKIGKAFRNFNFDARKYIPEMLSVDVNEDIIKEYISMYIKYLIPIRNEKIYKACKKTILPISTIGYSPCGLKTNMKYPCETCRFEYSKMSKRFSKCSDEELNVLLMKIEV